VYHFLQLLVEFGAALLGRGTLVPVSATEVVTGVVPGLVSAGHVQFGSTVSVHRAAVHELVSVKDLGGIVKVGGGVPVTTEVVVPGALCHESTKKFARI
jgi:hypothetical protein